ncbi:hypothetical protein HMPREF1982_02588 [Clostridiales bacterium oral taxon 876 str. F0540]|nr:hypothetical protein HMPREF1982_02588 [Clostridiales bacterium oral taxon 876 str. F0540]
MKRFIYVLIALLIIACAGIFAIVKYDINIKYYLELGLKHVKNIKGVEVPEEYSKIDKNKNGTPDSIDIVNTARKEAENETLYKDAYYVGGYPPDNEGVCTDVVWRGLKGAGIDLKTLIDKDIKQNMSLYTRVNGKPDPNIDFRRVKNLDVFLKRNAESLTRELKPFDVDNLKQWQPGDIVIIMQPFEHVAIVSDKRDKDGVPKVIHNTTPHAKESSSLVYWAPNIYGHYRWKY